MHLRRGLIASGTNSVIRGLALSVSPHYPPSLGRREGLKVKSVPNDQRFKQSCLCDEARASGVCEGAESGPSREDTEARCTSPPSPQAPPHVALHLAVHPYPLSYLLINRQNIVSLSSVSHSRKLRPRRALWEPIICSQIGLSCE